MSSSANGYRSGARSIPANATRTAREEFEPEAGASGLVPAECLSDVGPRLLAEMEPRRGGH